MRIPFAKRPICPSCGVKMKLIQYKGYYEEFRYWECENGICEINNEKERVEPDYAWKGSYA